ncbi:uncharacterized protein KY384_006536 [Bacidia gigantensis]|uniref:uncharacterized protein n=1 Tax=Bacidia gigantensis TaxID=2732470 RepID=UPI001D0490D3|nr:uncharacterized protein KY384_006536 [Bacidia gigantensis]KAG8528847.1 hypothetical protein KY384_006536 [Bacidia gigantensis]
MTRPDLTCIHEPFGDAFYYGPERLSSRFENDERARIDSGFSESTYQTVIDRIHSEESEGVRLFIKDIIHYLFPPDGATADIAPTLATKRRGVGTSEPHLNGALSNKDKVFTATEKGNPTVLPTELLDKFHFTFLIRHPRSSIPSYYRCTIPPLDEVTGFRNFMPSEAGIEELRRAFDYLRSVGQIGPATVNDKINKTESDHRENGYIAGSARSTSVEICVVDADDLLDDPAGIVKTYCKSVGLKFDPNMLNWDTAEKQELARAKFEKWKGFHEDAIESCGLKPRTHGRKEKSEAEEDAEWAERFGPDGAKVIRDTVNANIKDYEYLKRFALKPSSV